jgi:4-hydroxybenzoyl-CoA reductase subunit beta
VHLDPFELHRPTNLAEVTELAARLGPGQFDLIAGGTDLLPNYKMRLNVRPHLIALWDVAELRGHDLGRIGAMSRLADLERDPALASAYPALADAIRQVATPLVRASATVGGNLLLETRCFFFNQSAPWRQSLGYCLKADGDRCHVVPQRERCYATFSGDLAPALAVHDATVEVVGARGHRTVPVLDLYDAEGDGIRRVTLAPGEVVGAVQLPVATRGLPSSYTKLRVRPSFDFPELGVAALLALDDGRIEHLRLALGGLEMRPRRFDELTEPLVGARWTPAIAATLAGEVQRRVRPVHNTFLAPDYRKRMTGVFVRRSLERLAASPASPPRPALTVRTS